MKALVLDGGHIVGAVHEMEKDVGDRRVRRTRRLLAQAMISLVLEKGYEEVTIRDITGRADVGYATFFRHYESKDALLGDVLEVVLDDLLRLLKPGEGESETGDNPVAVGGALFRYVGENAEICRVLLGDGASTALVRRMVEIGTRDTLRLYAPDEEARRGKAVPAEVAAHHLVVSSIALIRWWLEHGMPYPPERMGEIYQDLIEHPTLAVAFDARPS